MSTWREALRRMLEFEKTRLEHELAEIERARMSLAEMNEQELLAIHDRFGREPAAWCGNCGAAATPRGV